MKSDYLHNHKEFPDLIHILSDEMQIIPQLIEKDYWIMHVLYGLKKQGFEFELKGGTSLSKGFRIIDRFSEDIDIHIKPTSELKVETSPNKIKNSQVESRKNFYSWLSENIKIDGIEKIIRDENFDDKKYYRNGGIRLIYNRLYDHKEGLKDDVLLEAGFDNVTPNSPLTISSWAFDRGFKKLAEEIIDNRAIDISCYDPGFTLVEKLQTIATKYRIEKETGIERANLMRQYYDVYCLLGNETVKKFIGSNEYLAHKTERFPNKDLEVPINKNEAFLLSDSEQRKRFEARYKKTSDLYYKGQPDFEALLSRIRENIDTL